MDEEDQKLINQNFGAVFQALEALDKAQSKSPKTKGKQHSFLLSSLVTKMFNNDLKLTKAEVLEVLSCFDYDPNKAMIIWRGTGDDRAPDYLNVGALKVSFKIK